MHACNFLKKVTEDKLVVLKCATHKCSCVHKNLKFPGIFFFRLFVSFHLQVSKLVAIVRFACQSHCTCRHIPRIGLDQCIDTPSMDTVVAATYTTNMHACTNTEHMQCFTLYYYSHNRSHDICFIVNMSSLLPFDENMEHVRKNKSPAAETFKSENVRFPRIQVWQNFIGYFDHFDICTHGMDAVGKSE